MDARVRLYVRQSCHLCEDARATVAAVCNEADEQWVEIDIDAARDPELRARFTDLVPVVEVDGNQVGYWRIRADNVRAALARAGGQ